MQHAEGAAGNHLEEGAGVLGLNTGWQHLAGLGGAVDGAVAAEADGVGEGGIAGGCRHEGVQHGFHRRRYLRRGGGLGQAGEGEAAATEDDLLQQPHRDLRRTHDNTPAFI